LYFTRKSKVNCEVLRSQRAIKSKEWMEDVQLKEEQVLDNQLARKLFKNEELSLVKKFDFRDVTNGEYFLAVRGHLPRKSLPCQR